MWFGWAKMDSGPNWAKTEPLGHNWFAGYIPDSVTPAPSISFWQLLIWVCHMALHPVARVEWSFNRPDEVWGKMYVVPCFRAQK